MVAFTVDMEQTARADREAVNALQASAAVAAEAANMAELDALIRRLSKVRLQMETAARALSDLRRVERLWRQFCANALISPDWAQTQEQDLRQFFDETVQNLRTAIEYARQLEGTWLELPSSPRLRRSLDQLEHMRKQIFEHWPLSRRELEVSFPLNSPGNHWLAPFRRASFYLRANAGRYENAAPVILAAGALGGMLCHSLSLAPLLTSTLACSAAAAVLISLAYAADE